MTDDELERRKEETWSMDEIRGGSATPDTEDTEDTGETAGISETEDTSDTTDTEDTPADGSETESTPSEPDRATGETVRRMALDAEEKGLAVRDLHNVNVYLYESVHEEMVATFKQLDTEYYREHGEDLSKNKDFFNAVFRAGLESPQLREELELD